MPLFDKRSLTSRDSFSTRQLHFFCFWKAPGARVLKRQLKSLTLRLNNPGEPDCVNVKAAARKPKREDDNAKVHPSSKTGSRRNIRAFPSRSTCRYGIFPSPPKLIRFCKGVNINISLFRNKYPAASFYKFNKPSISFP